jgi:hypothetical protein
MGRPAIYVMAISDLMTRCEKCKFFWYQTTMMPADNGESTRMRAEARKLLGPGQLRQSNQPLTHCWLCMIRDRYGQIRRAVVSDGSFLAFEI